MGGHAASPGAPDAANDQGFEPGIDRRRAIATGVAVGAAAWVAPAVLLTEPAQAQATPSLADGTLSGVVARCSTQNPLFTGEQFEIEATSQTDSSVHTTTTAVGPGIGSYLLSLPADTYDVAVTQIAPFVLPSEVTTNIVVTSGSTTFFNHAYALGSC